MRLLFMNLRVRVFEWLDRRTRDEMFAAVGFMPECGPSWRLLRILAAVRLRLALDSRMNRASRRRASSCA